MTVEYEHALSGAVTVSLQPGQRLSINPVMSRHWTMAAENWEPCSWQLKLKHDTLVRAACGLLLNEAARPRRSSSTSTCDDSADITVPMCEVLSKIGGRPREVA